MIKTVYRHFLLSLFVGGLLVAPLSGVSDPKRPESRDRLPALIKPLPDGRVLPRGDAPEPYRILTLEPGESASFITQYNFVPFTAAQIASVRANVAMPPFIAYGFAPGKIGSSVYIDNQFLVSNNAVGGTFDGLVIFEFLDSTGDPVAANRDLLVRFVIDAPLPDDHGDSCDKATEVNQNETAMGAGTRGILSS